MCIEIEKEIKADSESDKEWMLGDDDGVESSDDG